VHAPCAGTVRDLSDVPDVVFCERMLGPGLALDPFAFSTQVLAPVDGTLVAVHPHAFALRAGDGRGVLVHLGLDTVELAGRGFVIHRSVGEPVRTGDLLLTWDPVDVAAAGRTLSCPVIALQADPADLALLALPGQDVVAGQPLFAWS